MCVPTSPAAKTAMSAGPTQPASTRPSQVPVSRLVPEGDHVSLSFDGHTARLGDLKGLRHLARLLAEPGREFHALDLVTAEQGRSGMPAQRDDTQLPRAGGDLGPPLDEQAKAARAQAAFTRRRRGPRHGRGRAGCSRPG